MCTLVNLNNTHFLSKNALKSGLHWGPGAAVIYLGVTIFLLNDLKKFGNFFVDRQNKQFYHYRQIAVV